MNLSKTRNCPICGGRPANIVFPFATMFNAVLYNYLKCSSCASVFVDPVPDNQTFSRMYAKADYHDRYYDCKENQFYTESVDLLKQYLSSGSLVLDYGCGTGDFLRALDTAGYIPFGVEFDEDAARSAGEHAGCSALSVVDFLALSAKPTFDAIHFGDVLEHLPDPLGTLRELTGYLNEGGILFVEGPLEINPSPVFWVSRAIGLIKKFVRPNFIPTDAPTHLFRTAAPQQLAFLKRVGKNLTLKQFRIYDTGWPYVGGGIIKGSVAWFAVLLSGKSIFGVTFGNRFQAICKTQ